MDRTASVLKQVFAPKIRKNVWQWSEDNVYLSARVSPTPGPYRTDWCPYVRAPMEDYTDPRVRFIILCWAARSSKTETALNCIRYSIAEDPSPTLIIQPSSLLARSFSETRFQPSIDDCPILASEKPEDDDQYKLLEMHFRRMSVWLTGSNSPANLKGRGIGRLMADEVDVWPMQSQKETGALQQAYERTKERWDAKHIITSTPTIASGQIWYEFKSGDQRYYYVPCPHCGEYQVLKMKQLQWDPDARESDTRWNLKRIRETVKYICQKCGGEITDKHKRQMLTDGQWQSTVKDADFERKSYHLSSLYPSWIPFHRVATEFVQANGSPEERQKFVNSWLAEPFYLGGNVEEFEAALSDRAKEQEATTPDGWLSIMTIDVQATSVWAVIRAHAEDKSSKRLWWGQLPGLEESEMLANKWNCAYVFVDARYRYPLVVEWCHQHRGWIPVMGSGGLMVPFRWVEMENTGSKVAGVNVRGLRVRPADFKEELFNRIHGKGPAWLLTGDVGKEYKHQMSGETRIVRRGPRGAQVVEWIKTGPNHLLDCESNQLACMDAVRPFAFERMEKPKGAGLPPMPGPVEPERDHATELERERAQARSRDGGMPLWQDERNLWT